MKKQRPDVDEHAWEAAETLLELSDKFNSLREDIRTDLKWGLAAIFQREWEAFCEEQKL